jgi:hypothetical protein
LFNGAVELFLDDTGIDSLIGELQSLRGKTTHIHKMTFAWDGKELSKQVPRQGSRGARDGCAQAGGGVDSGRSQARIIETNSQWLLVKGESRVV